MRDRIPHLALRAGEAIGVVGPLVQPAASACLRCVDLRKAEGDPQWPKILAQATFTRAQPQACDIVLAAMTATVASAQALAYIDGVAGGTGGGGARGGAGGTAGRGGAGAANGTLEIVLPDWRWRRRTWRPHPDCSCGAARPASACAGSGR
jgi:hypothetical protein